MKMYNNHIRTLRKRKNMTLKELGEIINVSESTISLYENGHREPDFETLIKIAKYFNVTIDYLLGNETVDLKISNEIQILYDQLNDNQKSRLIGYAKGMLAESEHFDKNSILNKKLK